MELLENKIDRFVNELKEEYKIATAFKEEFQNMSTQQIIQKYKNVDELKKRLIEILNEPKISSDATRNKNLAIVARHTDINKLIAYVWNIILAGGGNKVIK